MNKNELRKRYKFIRNNIQNKSDKDYIIYQKIVNSDFYKKSNIIALYSSINNEVDTIKIFEKCKEDKKTVCFPKVIDDINMNFYRINSIDELSIGNFNIKEPTIDELNLIDSVDLMIIPGICFDKNNNRIGYGKGYYDAYLSKYPNIIKVAICYQEQITDKIPTNDNDIKMDYIITD